jgi:hypothetical protein
MVGGRLPEVNIRLPAGKRKTRMEPSSSSGACNSLYPPDSPGDYAQILLPGLAENGGYKSSVGKFFTKGKRKFSLTSCYKYTFNNASIRGGE